ncbi:hypothetical protein BGZ61DRAFT_475563 [Ilyonectria robusta]|uniref:uncharacterized protein n=1 Tax=Ilyonectria robusta TaxID=1079257 RepID=UPI001E8DC951|nr:uncharacterized protein BGZ61DRAFT_475563 [Ilyonectria robusta]KAH8721595.1 hypothetical protein BGZ61DRAFT_475563 [Ilyonectria robusta]
MVVKVEDLEVKYKMRAKYTEFLGLPLSIEPNSPLRFTIIHRVHGRQMLTGWPLLPTRLIDCINKKNNILIKTSSSNYFKSNFHKSYYPMLKDLLLDVQIPLEWADESIQPRPFNARLELVGVKMLNEEDNKDTFEGWDSEEDEDKFGIFGEDGVIKWDIAEEDVNKEF